MVNIVGFHIDLPRAWEPDGSPVKGHWETSFDWGFIPQTRRYVTDPIPLEEDEKWNS